MCNDVGNNELRDLPIPYPLPPNTIANAHTSYICTLVRVLTVASRDASSIDRIYTTIEIGMCECTLRHGVLRYNSL